MPLDRMNTETPNTIVLIPNRLADKYEEGRCGATDIYPGMLIQRASDGRFVPHSDAGDPARMVFAIEDAFMGKTIDDKYEEDQLVRMHSAQKDDLIWAFLANGEDVAIGDKLASDGNGAFASVGGGDASLVEAEEALNNTSGSRKRIRVRVL